ncbi:hypothetical protein K1719_021838 [Acacia pycnantha]|nr:hypothetical protein K1719_021838 [Acacia pycnantha]
MGNSIGKAIRLDIHTTQRARGKFARMCVELDITMPLIPEFNVEGQVLSMVYESLGRLCQSCGRVGHAKEGCEAFQQRSIDAAMKVDGKEEKIAEARENDLVEVDQAQHNNQSRRSNERLQKEVLSVHQSKKVGDISLEGGSRGFGKTGPSMSGRNSQEVRKTRLERGKNADVMARSEHGSRNEKEVKPMLSKKEGMDVNVLGTHRYKEVKVIGKENIHPGEQSTRVAKMETKGASCTHLTEVEEDTIENVETSMDIGGGTPGEASKGFAAVLRDLKFRHRLDVAVILEPRISGNRASRIIRNWGFRHSIRMEAEGFAGGIWIVWDRDDLSINVIVKEEQFIHSTGITEPWLIAGDFNEIRSPFEQKGGGRINEMRCRRFNDWIQDCGLVDVEIKGPFFTWKWPKWEGLDRVYKRLDRCLCNISWLEAFENAEVRIIPRLCSDHHPILVNLNADMHRPRVKQFKYEAMWQMHEQFKEVMKHSWRGEEEVHKKLLTVQQELMSWNKEVFGKIEGRKRRLMNRLNGIQCCIAERNNPFMFQLEMELEEELMSTLRQEEVMWFQKSRAVQ